MPESVESALPETRAAAGRILELDGLRGIAILLVLLMHFVPARGPLTIFSDYFYTGWIGVDLFFVLSGYLITGILLDSRGRPHYYRYFIIRRCLRIFPLYYACLALNAFVVTFPAAPRFGEFLQHGVWWYITYTGNILQFIQNRFPDYGGLIPLWSLQVEEQFYLTYPLLIAIMPRGRLKKVLVGAVAGSLLLRIAFAFALPHNLFATYSLTPCRLDGLALGGLIAIAQRERAPWLTSRIPGWVTAGAALLFAGIWLVNGNSPWTTAMRTVGYGALDLAFAGLLVLVLHRRQAFLLGLCRVRVLAWVGTISYSLYLLHIPVSIVTRQLAVRLTGLVPGGTADFALSFAAALTVAWLSWRFFEAPILRLKRHFEVH